MTSAAKMYNMDYLDPLEAEKFKEQKCIQFCCIYDLKMNYMRNPF